MKFFLSNGFVFNDKNLRQVNHLYSLSENLLNRISCHPCTLFYSNLQIALSSILIACSMINGVLTKDFMNVLNVVYDCKFEYFSDAYCKIYS